ncbi:hypothetical protein SteCoe_3833 [Stentor coeruleus]|uniref:B box-type domain-containing protein n=1 Tax=Stentor coeruleus TaxID=5963 RepID=A0A1R2CW89_9CILI|nr:hypothetical protein SteCoe_3833 [Stentor coeruleus]
MGNNASKKPNRAYQSSVKVSVPNLVYINRNTKELLVSISHDVSLANLKQKVKVYKNSAVGCLDDGTLVVAGGSDSSFSLTNKVFIINAYQKTVTELPLLPYPIKFGQFCRSNDYLYCLGGLAEPEDNDSSQVEEASPLMRYNFESKTWEVFKHKNNNTPGHLLRRKILSEKGKQKPSIFLTDYPLLKDLIFPAVAYFDEKIYTFGGKIAVEGGFEVIDKIFSIQAQDDDLTIIEENYILPIKLSEATCQIKGRKCFLAGGLLENSNPNMEIFIINFDGKYVSKLAVDIDSPLENHYPIIVDDKGILCYSPPKLLYIREDKSTLYHFTMPSQDSLNIIDFVVEKKSNERKPYIKIFVDLSLVTISKNEIISRMSMQPNMAGNIKNDTIEKIDLEILNQNPFLRSKTIGNQVKVIVAECDSGHRLVKNPYDKRIKCNHCLKSTRSNWLCQGCSFYLCEDCSKALCDYKRFVGTMLKCSQGHYFSKPRHEISQPSSGQCLNCNETLSNLSLYCFICKEHLCSSCESSILKQISTNSQYNCLSSHKLEPILSSELCNFCTKHQKGILKYTCKNCSVYYCTTCTEHIQKGKSSENPQELYNKSVPSPLDVKLQIDINNNKKNLNHPKSLSFESSNNGKANHAETEPISPINSINPQDSKVENENNKSVLLKKPEPITNEELIKKILKKPVRGTKSPFFLNLSPAKNDSFGRHSISHIVTGENKSFFDVKDSENTSKLSIFEIPQKILHNSSNEPSINEKLYYDENQGKFIAQPEENFDIIGKRVENCELNEEYVSESKDIVIFNENEQKKVKDLKDIIEEDEGKIEYDGFNRDYENNIVLSRASYDIPMHHDKKVSETDIFLRQVFENEMNHKRNNSNKGHNPQGLNLIQDNYHDKNISFSDNSLSERQKKKKSPEKKSKGSKNLKSSIDSFKIQNESDSSQSSEEFEMIKTQIKHTKASAIKNENLPQEEESSYSLSSSVQSSVKKQELDKFPELIYSKKSPNFVEDTPLKPEKKLKFYEERNKKDLEMYSPRARVEEKKIVDTGKYEMEKLEMKNWQLTNKNFEEAEENISESEVFMLEYQNEDKKKYKKNSSESLSSSNEDNEDAIAPVIEERFAEDKIKALMEKISVFRQESSSSDEESAKKHKKNKLKSKNKNKNHSKSSDHSEESPKNDKKTKKKLEDDNKKKKSKEKHKKVPEKSSGEKKAKPMMGFAFIMGNPEDISNSSESSGSFVEVVNPYKKNLEESSISKDESREINYTESSHTSSSEFFFDEA